MKLDPHFGMLPIGAFEHCGDRRIRLHGGGGGVPIVSDAMDVLEDVVGGAVDVIDSAVQEVGKGIDQAAQAVNNTFNAALNDPVNTAIRATAFVVGGPAGLAAANAAISLGKGQSLESAVTNAAISYGASQIGMEAGSYAPTEYAPTVSQLATGAARSAMTGKDITQGALTSAINSFGNKELGDAINGPSSSGGLTSFEPSATNESGQTDSMTYKPLSSLYSSPIEYGLQGSSPGIKAGLDEGNTFNPDKTVNYGLTPSNDGGVGLMSADSANINKMKGAQGLTGTDAGGTYSQLGYTPSDASQNLGNSNSFINNPEVLGRDVAMTDTSNNYWLPKVDFAGALGLGANSVLPSSKPSAANPKNQLSEPKLLNGSELAGDSTGDPYYLQHLRQLYGSLTPNMGLDTNQEVATFASGGSTSNSVISVIPKASLIQQSASTSSQGSTSGSGSSSDPFPTATTGIMRGPLTGGGQRRVVQITPLQQLRSNLTGRMAAGGIAEKYAHAIPKGHKPEFITGLTGYYASGKGTGQSDDIDAILHDGDYVADADLVAALGDGSSKAGAEALEKFRRQVPHKENAEGGAIVPAKIADGEYVFPASFVTAIGQGDNKAGAKILDKMREAIRAHKRSAPTTKIPPKSKSPLEYLKMVKG